MGEGLGDIEQKPRHFALRGKQMHYANSCREAHEQSGRLAKDKDGREVAFSLGS